MRRAQNADTHALKQHRLFENTSPVCSSFVLVVASDMHLESGGGKITNTHTQKAKKKKKKAKNIDFHTAKNIQIQATLFRYF